MFSRYPYAIDDIAWPNNHPHLPKTAEVDLPSYLVEADRVSAKEWKQYILDALAAKFSVRPTGIGYHKPAERR